MNDRPLADAASLRLTFPHLLAIGNLLIRGTRREFLQFHLEKVSSRSLLLKDGSNRRTERHWLLTADGRFWRLDRVGTQRAFWRWLAPVVDFTLAEYRLAPGRLLATDELLMQVDPLKSPAGFPTASHLKVFLRKHPGQVFGEALFKEFWQAHCPELKPPDIWGETLELRS